MNQILALAQKDVRVVYRDRFMFMISLYSFLIALVARFGVRWVPFENLDLFLAPAIVLFGTILLGTLLGFALIEEREQGTWLLLRVVPIASLKVFAYLAASASLLSLLVSFLAAMLYGYPVAHWPAFVFMLVASSLSAPLVMLILGAFSSNKIEGLAVNKMISTAGLVPILVFFVPAPWQLVGAWCPFYWLYLGLLEAYAGDPQHLTAIHWPGYPLWLVGSVSVVSSLLASVVLARRYTRLAL